MSAVGEMSVLQGFGLILAGTGMVLRLWSPDAEQVSVIKTFNN